MELVLGGGDVDVVERAGDVWTWVDGGEVLLRSVDGEFAALLRIVDGESREDAVVLVFEVKLESVAALRLVGIRLAVREGPPWPLTSTTTVSMLPRPLGPSMALVLSVRRSVARGLSVGGKEEVLGGWSQGIGVRAAPLKSFGGLSADVLLFSDSSFVIKPLIAESMVRSP